MARAAFVLKKMVMSFKLGGLTGRPEGNERP
jgi:hypothetical protein